MRIFISKHQVTGLKAVFKYDLNGVLRALEFDGDWTQQQVQIITQKVPLNTETILIDIANQSPQSKWIFSEVTDISFEAFYKRYPRKVGPKGETEKQYNKLSDADKMDCILFISELIKLKGDGTAFPYPASYLNKKYWR